MFNELNVDGYFLEYDDARSGDFEPLRHVPRGKMVVLGLVTTKLNTLETIDELKARIAQARALPAAGAAVFIARNAASRAPCMAMTSPWPCRAAKLQLVVDTARAVWGYA